MEAKRTARDADPAWGEYLALTEGMVLMQDNKVMRPTSFSPMALNSSTDGTGRTR